MWPWVGEKTSRFGGNRCFYNMGKITCPFYPEEVGRRILHKSGIYMYQTTRRQKPVDRKLDIYRHINLEYKTVFEWFSSITPDKCHDNFAIWLPIYSSPIHAISLQSEQSNFHFHFHFHAVPATEKISKLMKWKTPKGAQAKFKAKHWDLWWTK